MVLNLYCSNLALQKACALGLIEGFKVGEGEFQVSHLQFADDSLLLCEADVMEIRNVKKILRCFELISGLKINYHKSEIGRAHV